MKIRYLSDLHMEFTGYMPEWIPPIGEDMVVLAGDVGVGVKRIEWAKQAFRGRLVLALANEHPQFVGSDLAPCFHSRQEDLFRPPVKLWISGHTHHSCVTRVNGIPLLSNQRGYPREGVVFSWDAVVEV